jgi:hypothetical protein
MRDGQIGWTVVSLAGLVSGWYYFLVRPWRRERRITLDGMLLLALATMVWQDELPNIFVPFQPYNSSYLNLGSWYNFIPGWLTPHGNRIAEPLLWVVPTYCWAILPPVLIGSYIMRKSRARLPQLGNFGLISIIFGIFVVMDLILEPLLLLPFGVYSYAGTIDWLTIFRGRYYQFPIYEAILWPFCWTVWTCLRYFKDDKGRTMVERGIDKVRLGIKGRTCLRVLALTGFCNLVFLLCYNVPHAVLALYQSPWPDDVTSRSYFSYMCGPQTAFACPGPAVPIHRPDSAHVGPNGKLIAPRAPRGE